MRSVMSLLSSALLSELTASTSFQTMSAQLDPATFLFDVPPKLLETFCKVMDCSPDSLGWKGLATRILPNWLEVRCYEMYATAGKSPSHELLWFWAQQNKTVADLIEVLKDMSNYRALSLFCPDAVYDSYSNTPNHFSNNTFSKPQDYIQEPSQALTMTEKCKNEDKRQIALLNYSDVIAGTSNFHQDLKIGESTFAEVYRGRWGNESFAVKVFKQKNKKHWKDLWEKFKTEIEVFQLYQHPNILELWGSFSEGEHYCLVYPFLANGSLYHRLHTEDSKRPLSWQERLDIIKGTSKAIYHLHKAEPCMVICGNITSSNILLDDCLQPKLSDFGMARLRPHSVNQSCTITMKTAFHSNLAYLPEEYIRDGKLSVRLDIYSLGTVILETCTGMKVMLEEPKQTLLRDMLSLEVEEKGSVDACLRFLDKSAGQWPTADALCLLRLGLECTSSRARARPNMETVLNKLSECLPLPLPLEEQPHTLEDKTSPPPPPLCSLPVEDDEMEKPQLPKLSDPHECSQSEVTFLGNKEHRIYPSSQSDMDCKSKTEAPAAVRIQDDSACCDPALDLYSSWPVECSCAAGAESEGCEDCWVNGFTDNPSFIPLGDRRQSFQSPVENQAKKRLLHKIQLYNQGILKTEELLSMTSE